MEIILVWILNAVALLIVAYILPGITVASFGSALMTLPITIVTLGLFLLVLNALVFWFAGSVLKGFQVNGFWWALLGALVYSIVSGLLSRLLAS
jgi:putative membrane protein